MRSEDLRLDPTKTCLMVVDVQERLISVMHEEQKQILLANLGRLSRGVEVLGLPVVITEQYPQGLGPSVPAVREGFGGAMPIAKTTFDATGEPEVEARLSGFDPSWSVLVAGIEAHICVYQTVRSLAARGFKVHVLADAVASRSKENYALGLDLARQCGAVVSSTETALFDLVGRAGTDAFRAISRAVK